MREYFVRSVSGGDSLDAITKWLNSLLGADVPGHAEDGPIVKVIDWHFVQTGRPYEYGAIARVVVEKL